MLGNAVTRTDFVQRPAAVKFKTVFEFPKVEVEKKNKDFFLKNSHRSHPEEKSDLGDTDPTPKRNLIRETWIPPRRKIRVREQDRGKK